jgi:hypothetical protein
MRNSFGKRRFSASIGTGEDKGLRQRQEASVGKFGHMLVIVLAVGALVALNAAPVVANDYKHYRDYDYYDDTGRPCGSLFDILEGDGGECGVLNPLTHDH